MDSESRTLSPVLQSELNDIVPNWRCIVAILDLTVSPRKKGVESFRESVAISEEIIRSSGLPNMLTPMSTVIEGEIEELLDLMLRIDRALIEAGHYRVYLIAKIDHRTDKIVKMKDKIEVVEDEIKRRCKSQSSRSSH